MNFNSNNMTLFVMHQVPFMQTLDMVNVNRTLDSRRRSCSCAEDIHVCMSADDEQVLDPLSKGHFVMTRDSTNSFHLVSEIIQRNDCLSEGSTNEYSNDRFLKKSISSV